MFKLPPVLEWVETFKMLIGGRAVDAQSGQTFTSLNPYTGQGWAVIPDAGAADVDAAVAAARAALDGEWGALTGFARAARMRRLGDLIAEHAERLARLEVQDSGKLYREMIGQMAGVAGWYHYFSGLADKLEGRQVPAPNPDYLVYTRRGVGPQSTVVREEIFGPVLSVYPFRDEADAVALANDTPYGLAAAVWTKNVHTAHRVAARIKAGSVWINAYRVVAPGVPFGGYGASGIGRENGMAALDEYTETKAVWVELSGNTRDPFVLG